MFVRPNESGTCTLPHLFESIIHVNYFVLMLTLFMTCCMPCLSNSVHSYRRSVYYLLNHLLNIFSQYTILSVINLCWSDNYLHWYVESHLKEEIFFLYLLLLC